MNSVQILGSALIVGAILLFCTLTFLHMVHVEENQPLPGRLYEPAIGDDVAWVNEDRGHTPIYDQLCDEAVIRSAEAIYAEEWKRATADGEAS